MIIKSAGKTDIGLVRKINEDFITLLPDNKLFIVCDGMGGHNAGEVASSTACEIVSALYTDFYEELLTEERLSLPRVFPPSTDVLIKAVRVANHYIYQRALGNQALAGMGTTIVAAAVEKDIMTILHVGDSRAYRYYDKTLTPLTVDHSWVAELEKTQQLTPDEAKNLVNRNVITRALGVKESVEIDISVRKIVDNDMYILCSDGLCGFVDDSDIRYVVKSCKGDIDKAVSQLVQMANEQGGMDNVSVVALKMDGKTESSDLQALEMVTVDAETPEYFPIEEEWGTKALERAEETKQTETLVFDTHGKRSKYLAFFFAVAVIIVVIYLIYKG